MTIDQAAHYLGIKRHLLFKPRYRARRDIPTIKLNRLVRFRREDLDAWLAQRRGDHEFCSDET